MSITPLGNVGTNTYASTTKVGTLTVTLTGAVPAGHTLLCSVVWEGSGPTQPNLTLTTNKGDTGVALAAAITGSTRQVAHGYIPIATALVSGDTVTFSGDATRLRWAAVVDHFSGLLISAADQTATNGAGSSTAMNGGTTGTTTQASELVYGAFALAPAAAPTITSGSGFTLGGTVATSLGSGDHLNATVYKIVSSTGTQSALLTQTSASAYAAVTATYKAAITQTLRPNSDVTVTGWTKVGSGSTFSAVTSDVDDTTYARSPNNPDGTVVFEVALPTPSPLPSAGYGANIGARLRANAFSSNTVKVALYNGSTKLKEGTFAVTGSVVEYDTALSAADVAAVTAANSTWVGLHLRVTPVAS